MVFIIVGGMVGVLKRKTTKQPASHRSPIAVDAFTLYKQLRTLKMHHPWGMMGADDDGPLMGLTQSGSCMQGLTQPG